MPCLTYLYILQSVLGYELRKEGEPHDSVEDARAAMKLVLAKIEIGIDDAAPVQQNDVSMELILCVFDRFALVIRLIGSISGIFR